MAFYAYFTNGKTKSELEADFQDSRHDQKEKENFITDITRLKTEANGTVFLSDSFHKILKSNNISSKSTAIYHPQANPVERFNRSLTEAFRFQMSDNPDHQVGWSLALKSIVNRLNSRQCQVTGFSPFEVQFGQPQHPVNQLSPEEEKRHEEIKSLAYRRSLLRYLQNKRQFDQRALLRQFENDEIVMIKTFHLSSAERNQSAKLYPPWEVAKIIQKVENHGYEVLKINGKRIKLNIKHIKGISKELQCELAYLFDSDENDEQDNP